MGTITKASTKVLVKTMPYLKYFSLLTDKIAEELPSATPEDEDFLIDQEDTRIAAELPTEDAEETAKGLNQLQNQQQSGWWWGSRSRRRRHRHHRHRPHRHHHQSFVRKYSRRLWAK